MHMPGTAIIIYTSWYITHTILSIATRVAKNCIMQQINYNVQSVHMMYGDTMQQLAAPVSQYDVWGHHAAVSSTSESI